MDLDWTQGICDFPPLKNAKGMAHFVDMVNFHCQFIPRVAELAVPLNELWKKNTKFVWGERQQQVFKAFKEAINLPPVLCVPDFSEPFILQTDASSEVLGVVH